MTTSILFATGLILTLLASLAVGRYLSEPLRAQLRELCGNRDRAEFWTAFSNVALVLTSSIFAMLVEPTSEPAVPAVLAVSHQLKWGLIGLVSTVLAVGWVLGRFIPRAPVGGSPALSPNPGGVI
jgi:hypothetical protein